GARRQRPSSRLRRGRRSVRGAPARFLSARELHARDLAHALRARALSGLHGCGSLAILAGVKRLCFMLALGVFACTTETVPPRIFDAVWCDVSALPCAEISEPGSGLPASCTAP